MFASNRVITQPQHKIPNNRWRHDSLNKVGEVNVFDPGSKEITYNVIKLLRVQINRYTMTIEPFPGALQKTEAPWKLASTTSTIVLDQSLVQDEFISVVMTKKLEEDSKFVINRFSPLDKHRDLFVAHNQALYHSRVCKRGQAVGP